MAFTGGNDRFRIVLDDVIHDGEIVRRQVPDNIDVMLKQTQVDAKRIVIIEITQRSIVHELADLPDRACEKERMIHHDLQSFAVSQFNQLFGLPRITGKRLLHEDMLAVVERCLRQLVVRPDRSDHGNDIDFRRFEYLRGVRSGIDRWIRPFGALQALSALVAHRINTEAVNCMEISDDIGPPIAIADYTYTQHSVLSRVVSEF